MSLPSLICCSTKADGSACQKAPLMYDRCGVHVKRYLKENNLPPEEPRPCITITFGEVAENHVGNQQLGERADQGFSIDDLNQAQKVFEEMGVECEYHLLNSHLPQEQTAQEAAVLVARGAIDHLVDSKDLLENLLGLSWDSKAKMRGAVKNKTARYNLCFDQSSQQPAYEQGQGTVVPWDQVPNLKKVRDFLPTLMGAQAEELKAEGNLYYNVYKCGIGFHGDAERKKVIALRLGESMRLDYFWYRQSKRIGTRKRIVLNHGDLYIMSEKATGFDWKKRSQLTLRHAAGCGKYLK